MSWRGGEHEKSFARRGDLHVPVAARRPQVRELLRALDVDHEIPFLAVLTDDHPLVAVHARLDEKFTALLKPVDRERNRLALRHADHRAVRTGGNRPLERFVVVEQV